MAKHNQTGKTGEELAAEYLIARGYIIRDINWKNGKLELDIVAYKDRTLIVVEVKTRSSDLFGHPEDAVNTRKIRHIIDATDAYIQNTISRSKSGSILFLSLKKKTNMKSNIFRMLFILRYYKT